MLPVIIKTESQLRDEEYKADSIYGKIRNLDDYWIAFKSIGETQYGYDFGEQEVEIFTDGACRGNPGPGGWAALLRSQGIEKMLSGAEPETTNNQMELMAAIQGLEALKRTSSVALTTDSQYVRQGITQWIHGWKRNGWKTSQKQPVKNKELWQRLDAAVESHDVQWHWVNAHSGHEENERVDQAANDAIDVMQAQS